MPAPTDPLYAQQWHLTGPWGIHLGNIWDEYTGAGVVVAVHDQGIDFSHSDLNDNIDSAHSFNASTGGSGGAPVTADDNHGTAVAGIIAAERNGTGVVGVAYGATLQSYYDPLFFSTLQTAVVNARNYAATHADVLNNSWGFGNTFFDDPNSAFLDNFAESGWAAARAATLNAAANGRGGLGTIIVQAAGNTYAYGDDTNLHSFQNNRWTITVGATNQDGTISDYSTPGASILIGAPGSPSAGTIVTTDRVGGSGYAAGDYTTSFNGTSAATPMVSGVVALMLEANPHLGWRDVQEILAYTARSAASGATTDQTNGATNWNGGGLTVNHDIGFGLVDAHAAVRLAESWGGSARTSANETSVSASGSPGLAIPDGNATGVTTSLTIATGIEIDRVEVTLNLSHTWIGDLQIVLTSPDGTDSVLVNRPGLSETAVDGSSQDNIAFTFSTVQDWGESGQGVWSLTLRDLVSGDVGVLNSWSLRLYGDAASANDTYVYTDEFTTVGADAARRTLADAGGVDTINGAALTGNAVIDLLAGTATIAGRAIAFAAGTAIENAITGDGNDQLTGGAGVNHLTGGRGDDVLRGGAGADVLDGGIGKDLVSYYYSAIGVTVSLAGGAGSGGDAQGDTYSGIENINGSMGADSLTGNGGANTLNGLAGDDILRGGAGGDVLQGDVGSDTASYYSSSIGIVANLATGTGSGGDAQGDTYSGIENLNGSKGADTLIGNSGVNILNGLGGKDVLTGGAGADRFVFSIPGDSVVGASSDRITDFSHAQGDRIDLSPIDAASTVAGSQAFSFIGVSLYTHHAGELRFAQFDGETIIGGDINGDGITDFHVRLTGTIALVAADFVL
ncbi:S8 family serine peptidase [Inquilinus limosus]|uniref:S8 family serine peptidase n=1 Tax=Inquilinus limosus TaxID=171674 RepID=UPI00068EB41B|nr:S8 family serine peptidase [Inquilinus limosus]